MSETRHLTGSGQQFITDFQKQDLDPIIAGSEERVAVTMPRPVCARPHKLPSDKWLLSSAVQKLIRRGKAEQAVKAALALHTLDPAYLPRRLPIIAFEDVSIGNLEVCFDALFVFGRQRFAASATDAEQRRVLANLVLRLAQSVKSRTACDIFCLAHADQNISIAAAKFARSSEQCLVAMACDRSAAVTSRALALHLLSGMTVQEGRWSRPVSRFNPAALSAVAERLDLSPVIRWMLINGRHTSGLAAMLPLALEAALNGTEALHVMQWKANGAQVYSVKSIVGVPAYSADQYTALGRQAIAEFSKAMKDKYSALFEGVPSASKLLGMAIFHAEGSKLDRWVENPMIADYRRRIEQIELQVLGLAPELHQQLYAVLETESRLLWQIRHDRLTSAFRGGK